MKRLTVAMLLVVAVAIAAAPVWAADAVSIGTTNSQSDAPLFIALERGYFREQGLEVTLQAFDSAAKMIVPLATGQLDVGAGSPSAGLFNAIGRGIDVRIVAAKSSSPPGYGYVSFLVRKALVDSGRVKSFADLRGLTVGEPGMGSTAFVTLVEVLARGGLTAKDVREVYLGFPDQMAALANGSIDATPIVEPFATLAVEMGLAVRFTTSDVLSPNGMTAVILYGGPFMKAHPDAAQRFMLAYLQAVRYYNDALKAGRLAGRTADDVIAILTKHTPIKDAALFRKITPNGVDPDGRVNFASLDKAIRVYRDAGFLEMNVTAAQAVDSRFADAAVKSLGRYKPNP